MSLFVDLSSGGTKNIVNIYIFFMPPRANFLSFGVNINPIENPCSTVIIIFPLPHDNYSFLKLHIFFWIKNNYN